MYNAIFFQDDDTRNVMTAMTNQTTAALESLNFYVVTKSWFVRAWPILTAKPNDFADMELGKNLREHIGKIQNSELVLSEAATKSQTDNNIDEKDDDDDENRESNHDEGNPSQYDINQSKLSISEYYSRTTENPKTTKMKPGLMHTRDYFFLGPSAWMLVKAKFGYDGYEICRSCKKVQPQIGQGRVAIALLPGEEDLSSTGAGSSDEGQNINYSSTIVPLSGRFPYEKVLSINIGADADENSTTQRNEMSNEVS